VVRFGIITLLGCLIWFQGVKPFVGELYFYKFQHSKEAKMAKDSLSSALDFDSSNSLYQFQQYLICLAGQQYSQAHDWLEKTIINNNGDLVPWSLWYMKGDLLSRMGDLYGAKDAFEKAMTYNLNFKQAKQAFQTVDDAIDGRLPENKGP
jgi:tetratricopeptide (TPR) repeat protein